MNPYQLPRFFLAAFMGIIIGTVEQGAVPFPHFIAAAARKHGSFSACYANKQKGIQVFPL
jgi:hypothetical protein